MKVCITIASLQNQNPYKLYGTRKSNKLHVASPTQTVFACSKLRGATVTTLSKPLQLFFLLILVGSSEFETNSYNLTAMELLAIRGRRRVVRAL
jgi:hypothetical protein